MIGWHGRRMIGSGLVVGGGLGGGDGLGAGGGLVIPSSDSVSAALQYQQLSPWRWFPSFRIGPYGARHCQQNSARHRGPVRMVSTK